MTKKTMRIFKQRIEKDGLGKEMEKEMPIKFEVFQNRNV
jgi:hypothetical protein